MQPLLQQDYLCLEADLGYHNMVVVTQAIIYYLTQMICSEVTLEGIQLGRNSCLQFAFLAPILKFHAIIGSGALCFGDLIILANSLTASWV